MGDIDCSSCGLNYHSECLNIQLDVTNNWDCPACVRAKKFTRNEKGALSYTADDTLLELFYKTLRNTPKSTMEAMVENAWTASNHETRQLHCLKLLFYLRWCRSGKGERELFRIGINKLLSLGAQEHVKANLHNFPFFGYWKDTFCLLGTPLESDVVDMWAKQLTTDLDNLLQQKPVSLSAKWAPSEGKELDREFNIVSKLCKAMKIDKIQYRKKFLVPLRKHLDIVERKLCDKDWFNINYAHVPSLARFKYTKTFREHDPNGFSEYMQAVANGKAKMNIKLVYPHQLVKKYLSHYNHEMFPSDDDLNTMWNQLVEQYRTQFKADGVNLEALGVADLSGSMEGIPLENSVALSLLWAELSEGPFHNHFYTFSRTAQLHRVQGATLKEKVVNMLQLSEIENTNLQAVFNDLLNHAQLWCVPADKIPKKLYIFTDGQFDQMVNQGDITHLDAIEKKFKQIKYTDQNGTPVNGLPQPDIIFWNLRGDIVDFPSPGGRKGVAMLSGFSPNLFELIFSGEELSPVSIMMKAINNPELNRVRRASLPLDP